MKKFLVLFVIFLLIFGSLTAGAFSWYKNNIDANDSYETDYHLIVETGASTDAILEELEENKIIKSKLAAKIYLKLNPSVIQAGEFDLNSYQDLESIFATLANAKEETVWVTIQEGLRYDEVADIWAEEIEDFDAKAFNNLAENKLLTRDTAEGYLFPDTYNVKVNITEEEAFDLMMTTFEEKVGEISYEELILASIVEREAKADEERPIVAGILQKRLDTEGWLLQADATLLYEYKDWTKTITAEMKATTSMYNTYYNPDLPPTPICNPGLESIDAARNPDTDTLYWFYLHDNNGKIHYAKTLTEHNQNIYTYLR